VKWCWSHEMPPVGRAKWGDNSPCLDQGGKGEKRCPGCEHGLDRSFDGFISVIWRDAPLYKSETMQTKDGKSTYEKLVKDASNNYIQIGTKDQVAVWNKGISVFEDVKYKGLMSRDFDVKRTGTGFDTKHRIDPADPDAGPVPMTEADVALAKTKPDLSTKVTPVTYEEMMAILNGGGGQGQPQGGNAAVPDDAFDRVADASPFAQRT
jgi:hypothetical protein